MQAGREEQDDREEDPGSAVGHPRQEQVVQRAQRAQGSGRHQGQKGQRPSAKGQCSFYVRGQKSERRLNQNMLEAVLAVTDIEQMAPGPCTINLFVRNLRTKFTYPLIFSFNFYAQNLSVSICS